MSSNGCPFGTAMEFLPDDPEQRRRVLCIISALRSQCEEDGEVGWEFDAAVKFVHKVKIVYSNDPRGYLLFLHILSKYQKKEKSLKDAYEEVKILFRYVPYLLEEFMDYLPSSLATRPSRRGIRKLTKKDALSYLATVKQTLHNEEKYQEFLKLVHDCKTYSVTPDMLMSKAQEILEGHEHLIYGLGIFFRRRK